MVRARNTDDSRYKEEQCKDPNPYNCDLPLSRHDRICTFSCCPYQHYSPPLFGPARYGRHLQPSADLKFPKGSLNAAFGAMPLLTIICFVSIVYLL